ncbi:MAG: D-alanine--D-alanine ligase [Thermacetogeniaceae bacterium]|jgi:D-alanine-D-alanine ligase
MSMHPQRVAVLMGGTSAEREISLRTGGQISNALSERGFAVRKFDPAGKFISGLEEFNPDVVFIALHGKFGEDGTIQSLLEVLGYAYTGSGVLSSALAMDKVMSKKVFLAEGITTPAHRSFRKEEISDHERARDELGGLFSYPVIVKPSRQGSTIGVTKVEREVDLEQALDLALRFDDQVIVEQFIAGIEVTASVLGTRDPEVLPLIEIVSETGFYDYTAKYSKSLSHHIIPARVAPETALQIERIALRAYQALNCRQFARVDFMVSRENIPYVLEVNTIPGLTETSLFPDAAKAVGISFSDLVARLVNEAWLLSKEGA